MPGGYFFYRPMTQKINYHNQLLNLLSTLNPDEYKPKLLLHACCAPCSSYVIEFLSGYFDITIHYYNPNIHPKSEYNRRLNELEKFVTLFPKACNVKLVKTEYDVHDFFNATNVLNEVELQTEHEQGNRCYRCYNFRMKKAFEYACSNNFDFFTTTLSISPHKNSAFINEIGFTLEKESDSVKYLPADFKKNNGYLRSLQLSKEYDLWRQDYCGCIYSKVNK